MINVLGPVFSISGNELAIRFGRQRIIFLFMTLSGVIACLIGYTAAWPWYIVVLLMLVLKPNGLFGEQLRKKV